MSLRLYVTLHKTKIKTSKLMLSGKEGSKDNVHLNNHMMIIQLDESIIKK